MAQPTLSPFVNDGRASVLAISAVPTEHLNRPLIVTMGEETLLDEHRPPIYQRRAPDPPRPDPGRQGRSEPPLRSGSPGRLTAADP